jgi:NAD(P)H dehydrogenase (quinone)
MVHKEGGHMERREFLKNGGVLSVAAGPALYSSLANAAEPQPVTVLVTYHSVTGNTEKMAHGLVDGVKAVPGASVVLKKVGEVATADLLSSDAVVVGSPVYFGSMSGEVKTFLDNWLLKFGVFSQKERKMRNKVGAAFTTGALISHGKDSTLLAILQAMLINQMVIVSQGGYGASATTGPDSPGIDDKELAAARDLGRRVAEAAAVVKRGSSK